MNQDRNLKTIAREAITKFINDMKYVKWVILAVVAYFALFQHFLYTICPLVLITGFPCPGCGMTRAAFQVLKLDFSGAWHMHPFIYLIILLMVMFCVQRYLMQRENYRVLYRCVVAVAIGMLLFYIWRMWRYYPGEPPMSYYYGSLAYRIYSIFR